MPEEISDTTTPAEWIPWLADRKAEAFLRDAPYDVEDVRREFDSGAGLLAARLKVPSNGRDVFRKAPNLAQGRLFRSAALSSRDVPWLKAKGIETIIDFRPSGSNPGGFKVIRLGISNGGGHGGKSGMEVRYVTKYRGKFASMINQVNAGLRTGNVLLHCIKGKDRTGFACSLIMAHLGVPESVIRDEYLASRSVGSVSWSWEKEALTAARAWGASHGDKRSIGGFLRASGVKQETLDELRTQLGYVPPAPVPDPVPPAA